jgi:ribosomal protein S12 methylthiotransferase
MPPAGPPRTVALVTLGCARNEVDSEEMAGRLEADGFVLVDDPQDADAVLVNTCGFVEQAKKDSVDTLLAAADLKTDGRPQAVVAVGCLAERYGQTLAGALPEADAVLGFDDYEALGARLRSILAGDKLVSHVPRDRRQLLPLSPTERPAQAATVSVPGHGHAGFADSVDHADASVGPAPASGPRAYRRRLQGGPMAPLKLASGCDRRCTFCAIPSFRGAFVSRRPTEVVDEARWLAGQGVKEIFLVSENSTSYGKDLGDLALLEALLPELAGLEGIERVRVSYLQPAETRPGLLQVITETPGVAAYLDLSFQHASADVLRRMRRFGDTDAFLDLLARARESAPDLGARSNVIVGFPGETEADVVELERFLTLARLDVVGVFGYSDEDGTEAATYGDKVEADVVAERVQRVSRLVEELTSQRAEDRIGERVHVLVEDVTNGEIVGRAAHQGPEVDGTTTVARAPGLRVGDLVEAVVIDTIGVDLIAEAVSTAQPTFLGSVASSAPQQVGS